MLAVTARAAQGRRPELADQISGSALGALSQDAGHIPLSVEDPENFKGASARSKDYKVSENSVENDSPAREIGAAVPDVWYFRQFVKTCE